MQNTKTIKKDIIIKINLSSVWRIIKTYLAIIGFILFVSICEAIIETIV